MADHAEGRDEQHSERDSFIGLPLILQIRQGTISAHSCLLLLPFVSEYRV
jgi:hypothetical protein